MSQNGNRPGEGAANSVGINNAAEFNRLAPTTQALTPSLGVSDGVALLYDRACAALAAAKSVDEVKAIVDVSVAMRAYAKQAKNRDLEADAVELRMRATRGLDQMRQAQAATVGLNSGNLRRGVSDTPRDDRPTLASQGIDKNLAKQARRLGALDEPAFEATVASARSAVALDGRPHLVHRALGTGDSEWYTPDKPPWPIISMVRDVMGAIDLDPTTSEIAQRTVRATNYFTEQMDGLRQDWRGKVWLNPPYSNIVPFIEKLIAEYQVGHVVEAILLTHNYTDTRWFHKAVRAASAFCLTLRRIPFVGPDGKVAAAQGGQCFFYFGTQPDVFAARFAEIGFVAVPWAVEIEVIDDLPPADAEVAP